MSDYLALYGNIGDESELIGLLPKGQNPDIIISKLRFFRDGRLTQVIRLWSQDIGQAVYETYQEFEMVDILQPGIKFEMACELVVEVRPNESIDRSPTCPKT